MLLLGGGFALAKGSEVSGRDSRNVNGFTAYTQYGKNNNVTGGGNVVVVSWLVVFKVTKDLHEIR